MADSCEISRERILAAGDFGRDADNETRVVPDDCRVPAIGGKGGRGSDLAFHQDLTGGNLQQAGSIAIWRMGGIKQFCSTGRKSQQRPVLPSLAHGLLLSFLSKVPKLDRSIRESYGEGLTVGSKGKTIRAWHASDFPFLPFHFGIHSPQHRRCAVTYDGQHPPVGAKRQRPNVSYRSQLGVFFFRVDVPKHYMGPVPTRHCQFLAVW